MSKQCDNCKFCVLQDTGYSNYTVEGTDVMCMLNLHPDTPFDRGSYFAQVDSRLLYAEQCEGYAEGNPVEIDCDREKAEYSGMIPVGYGGHDDLMPYVEGNGDPAQYVAFKLMIERGEI